MLSILFEDAHLLAIDKPAGTATQGRPGSAEMQVRAYLDRDGAPPAYLGTVHRLDSPVSGVLLWAKTPKAARRMAEQFASRSVRKQYLAAVSGELPIDRGEWEDWLYEEDTGLGRVQVCRAGTPRARRAFTRFERVEASSLPERTSLLRLLPETGRTHQLRVQSASRGAPILGDSAYGSTVGFPEGIALHARSLGFRHPIRDEALSVEAPLPASWAASGIVI